MDESASLHHTLTLLNNSKHFALQPIQNITSTTLNHKYYVPLQAQTSKT